MACHARVKEYKSFPTPHIGVAVDTEEGLVVPVVKNPAALSVSKIHAEIIRLTERARSRALSLEEIRGGALRFPTSDPFPAFMAIR